MTAADTEKPNIRERRRTWPSPNISAVDSVRCFALNRGRQAADEREPERELLDVLVLARHVESAERPADRVDQQEDGRQRERGREDGLPRCP